MTTGRAEDGVPLEEHILATGRAELARHDGTMVVLGVVCQQRLAERIHDRDGLVEALEGLGNPTEPQRSPTLVVLGKKEWGRIREELGSDGFEVLLRDSDGGGAQPRSHWAPGLSRAALEVYTRLRCDGTPAEQARALAQAVTA